MKLLPAFFVFLLFVFETTVNKAQDVFCSGARFQAMADASAGLSDDWSVFGNQAGLAAIKRPEFGGSFQNRFLVNELSTRAVFFAVPIESSVFAFSLSQFGQIPFRQEKYGLAYARPIGQQLYFGLQFTCYRLFLSEENRTVGSYGVEIGIQYLPAKKLTFGAHVVNPYQTAVKLSMGKYRFPSRIRIGICYHLSSLFNLASEIEDDLDSRLILKTGFEYAIQKKFFVRAGVSGKPYQLSGGIGFRVKKLVCDLASSYNPYLGHSPIVSFQYQF